MLEFHLDAETFRSISQFKNEKVPVGTRPLMVFAGSALYGLFYSNLLRPTN